jgi:nucleotide-binding universal stress UspA family protein
MKSISERLVPSNLKIRTEVLLGAPRSAVPEYAKNWAADFVIVGSHGSSGLARFLLGSVAQNVVRTAPCSVEIVRANAQDSSHAQRGLKILLATDGSDCSTAAARSVATRPWPTGTCVKVISVVSPFFPVADVFTGYFEAQQALLPAETIEKTARFRAAEAIAQTDRLLRESSFAKIERSAPLLGDPKAVILDEAAPWGADLIVVGSHGWRGFDRLMMGSVSESVAVHAHCSVEVIR